MTRRFFYVAVFLLALNCAQARRSDALAAKSAPRDTTIYEPEIGFAFDIPRGWSATHEVAGNGQNIAGWLYVTQKSGWPYLGVESERFRRWTEPLSDPGDTLLSYVKFTALQHCGAGGPEGSVYADSIIALRRYRSDRGYQVFEITVRVVQEDYPGGGDDEDSTSVADSAHVAEPVTAYTHSWTVGPIYAVDLSRAGVRLVVWVRPSCDERSGNEAGPVGRRISQTLRRID
jgi:hypothetical protein